MTVPVREVSSILVNADRDAVYAALLPRGLAPDGVVTTVPGERVEVRAGSGHDARGARRWFLLRDAPGHATRVIHGIVVEPVDLRERVSRSFQRDGLRREVEDALLAVKRRVETP